MVIGLLAIAAIPSTIGICQGVSQQKRQVAEAKKAAKFNLKTTIVRQGRARESYIILKDGKVSPPNQLPTPASLRSFYETVLRD